jgi:two-component system chemotaxis sensor kinase CheA
MRVSDAKIATLLNAPNELMRWHVLEEQDLEDLRDRLQALFDRADAAGRIADRDLRHAALEQALTSIAKQRDATHDLVKTITERNARRPRSLEDLRQGLASLRMLPVNTILAGMPRLVRDTALALGKNVELEVHGADVEIGKSVLDRLMEPLIQMVKNAIAHGIETPDQRIAAGKAPTGLITISVSTGTASATITVEDDGRGLDSERIRAEAVAQGLNAREAQALPEGKLIQYLFKPGFSTTDETDSISGRGVGLDIVAECLRQLRGTYQLENSPGKGLRLLLTVPVTLLWSPVLQLRSGGFDLCVRLADICEANVLRSSDALEIDGRLCATVHDEVIPLLPLAAVAGGDNSVDFGTDDKIVAVTLQQGERRAAFVVDKLTDVSDVIVKPLPWPLMQLPGLAGYCVLATGSALCVLDGEYLVNAAHDRHTGGTMRAAPIAVKPTLLIVDDSLTTRTLLRSIMMGAGYDASTAVDGVDAWEKIQSGRYDCIVSDIEMPNMNGWDLCARVKSEQRYAGTPFVLITSLSKDDERRRGFEAGADAYIVKSLFNEKELLETVQRLTV